MKAKVRLTQTVELYVEGGSEEEIMEWLYNTRPEEALTTAFGDYPAKGIDDYLYPHVVNIYGEEILETLPEDVEVDYKIEG